MTRGGTQAAIMAAAIVDPDFSSGKSAVPVDALRGSSRERRHMKFATHLQVAISAAGAQFPNGNIEVVESDVDNLMNHRKALGAEAPPNAAGSPPSLKNTRQFNDILEQLKRVLHNTKAVESTMGMERFNDARKQFEDALKRLEEFVVKQQSLARNRGLTLNQEVGEVLPFGFDEARFSERLSPPEISALKQFLKTLDCQPVAGAERHHRENKAASKTMHLKHARRYDGYQEASVLDTEDGVDLSQTNRGTQITALFAAATAAASGDLAGCNKWMIRSSPNYEKFILSAVTHFLVEAVMKNTSSHHRHVLDLFDYLISGIGGRAAWKALSGRFDVMNAIIAPGISDVLLSARCASSKDSRLARAVQFSIDWNAAKNAATSIDDEQQRSEALARTSEACGSSAGFAADMGSWNTLWHIDT